MITAVILILISTIRIAVGLAPFVAAPFAFRAMKLSEDQVNDSALIMLRIFGVREIAVGVLSLIFRNEAALLVPLLWVNFFVDAGDVLAWWMTVQKNPALKTAAKASVGVDFLAVLGWSVALWCR